MATWTGAQIDALAQAVREARFRHNWDQKTLAAQAGVTKGYISKLENAKSKRPSADELGRVLKTLALPTADVVMATGVTGGATPTPPDWTEWRGWRRLVEQRLRAVERTCGRQSVRRQQVIDRQRQRLLVMAHPS